MSEQVPDTLASEKELQERGIRLLDTILSNASALQYEGGFTAHDLEDLRYADLLLAELQSRFETQGDE